MDQEQFDANELRRYFANAVSISRHNGPKLLETSSISFGFLTGPRLSADQIRNEKPFLADDESPVMEPITCAVIAGALRVCEGVCRMFWSKKLGQRFIQVYLLPLNIDPDVKPSGRVLQLLHRSFSQGQGVQQKHSLLTQCLVVKNAYLLIKKQSAQNRNENMSVPIRPTLRQVALQLFSSWPQKQAKPDLSFLLLQSQRSVEQYWTCVVPLLQAKDALGKLYRLETHGLLTPWEKRDLSSLNSYSEREVQEIVDRAMNLVSTKTICSISFKRRSRNNETKRDKPSQKD